MSKESARSKQLLEKEGYLAQVVERWQSFFGRNSGGRPGVRIDLFGIIDIVAVQASQNGVLGVQSTSGANASSRMKKALESKALRVWLEAGNRFEVHGWAKRGDRGKRKLWSCRREPISLNEVAFSDETIKNILGGTE
jgi:hypothetical protein